MPSCGRGRAADGERAGVERVGPDRRAAAGATPTGERRLPSGDDAARTHDLVGDGPAGPEDLDKTRMQVERPADHGRLASSSRAGWPPTFLDIGRRTFLQRLEVDRLGDGIHSRVVRMYPVAAVVFGPHPVRICGIGEHSVEIHDGIVGAAGTDPAVHGIAYRLATLRIVSGKDGPLGRHDRRADDADTVIVRGLDQGLIAVDELSGGHWLASGGFADGDVVYSFKHDHRADLRLFEHISPEPVKTAGAVPWQAGEHLIAAEARVKHTYWSPGRNYSLSELIRVAVVRVRR